MVSERSVQDGGTVVKVEEKSMARLAEVLRENGVNVVQFSDFLTLPTVYFCGNCTEARRVFDVAVQHGFADRARPE